MLIRPAIDDTDPIRYRRPTPDGQFSGNIIDEAMRPASASNFDPFGRMSAIGKSPKKRAIGLRTPVLAILLEDRDWFPGDRDERPLVKGTLHARAR